VVALRFMAPCEQQQQQQIEGVEEIKRVDGCYGKFICYPIKISCYPCTGLTLASDESMLALRVYFS